MGYCLAMAMIPYMPTVVCLMPGCACVCNCIQGYFACPLLHDDVFSTQRCCHFMQYCSVWKGACCTVADFSNPCLLSDSNNCSMHAWNYAYVEAIATCVHMPQHTFLYSEHRFAINYQKCIDIVDQNQVTDTPSRYPIGMNYSY